MLRSLSLLGISLMMGLSVAAQDGAKVKIGDKETKYKSEDLKIKEEKKTAKYKSDDVKIKEEKHTSKYKSDDLKIKDEKSERKIKGTVKPMQVSTREEIEMRTGETKVRTQEHLAPITQPVTEETTVATPTAIEPVAVPKTAATIKKTSTRKYASRSAAPRRRVAASKSNVRTKYVVRTQVVKDTVFVPSPPEKVVTTQTEYVHDTVLVSRVDTVVRMQTTNTYSGYQVPRGDFKKVKLKKDKDGEVHMKRKE
jgi:hypothetical protein